MATNCCYAPLDDMVTRAISWLAAMPPLDPICRCGFAASKFDWLLTYALAKRSMIKQMCLMPRM